ncbi:arylsulfatase [Marinilongibacter aquaticus]|uniref:sulfatase family protein n=1 Tax=Marinilongibacter aquaticus TaxID=2975157 RepID=UPI0021BDE234|nr:arylsulfatase [Marinilongibacter aquaticus]UBM58697.1 arylsulfatase [Marinilongibacter aquaticus]
MKYYALTFFALICFSACQNPKKEAPQKPNILYILADDMGIGDVSLYNPDAKTQTPHIDQLGKEGMRFTDAHSPSSVCTPTRYGILTGRYCWRSKLPQGVLQGYGKALLEKDRETIASLLKSQGYSTGVIGKWHLGLDWVLKPEFKDSVNVHTADINAFGMVRQLNGDWVDFSQKPTDGPLNHGFDYSYILPASLDMEPYCYLENDVLTEIPSEYTPGNDLNTGSYATQAFWRPGKVAKSFDFYGVLPNFIERAKQFIRTKSKEEKPFFLYLPLTAPHSPWVPQENYKGTSGAGQYGDFVQMVDAKVGEVLKALEESGEAENTIIIFTSDNGPFWKPDFIERYNHRAAYIYRGMKADAYEGGHRIPLVVKWPGKVKAGTVSDFPTTLTNLLATCADLLNIKLDENTAEDSQSILPVLLGDQAAQTEAMPIVHHSSRGFFAIRKGEWKLIDRLGSGGFSEPAIVEPKKGEAIGQLYNLSQDPSETTNLYADEPEKVKELTEDLEHIKNR